MPRCPRRRRQTEEACTCCTRTQAASEGARLKELHTSKTTKTKTRTTTTNVDPGGRANAKTPKPASQPGHKRRKGAGIRRPAACARHLFRTGLPFTVLQSRVGYSCGGGCGDGHGHVRLVGRTEYLQKFLGLVEQTDLIIECAANMS